MHLPRISRNFILLYQLRRSRVGDERRNAARGLIVPGARIFAFFEGIPDCREVDFRRNVDGIDPALQPFICTAQFFERMPLRFKALRVFDDDPIRSMAALFKNAIKNKIGTTRYAGAMRSRRLK